MFSNYCLVCYLSLLTVVFDVIRVSMNDLYHLSITRIMSCILKSSVIVLSVSFNCTL